MRSAVDQSSSPMCDCRMDSRFRGNDRFRPLAGNHAPLGRTTEFILPPRSVPFHDTGMASTKVSSGG